MCGINGIVSFKSNPKDVLKVQRMNRALAHRGPDAEGLWNDEHVVLGHRRLSIIDLSSNGNQPMVSDNGNLVLVFNGEIYNFRALQKRLQAKGRQFRSGSDTEVVLQAYEEWGTECFAMFNGMFALAIYNKLQREIVLARDHAGIKPLYYSVSDNGVVFSSEIRGFSAYNPQWPSNTDWSFYFLGLGFIPFPYTTKHQVLVLPKGHFMRVKLTDFSNSIHCFQTFSFSDTITTEKEALKMVKQTLLDAIDRHMISDAPLGIFLSGGIDSSILSLLADRLGNKQLNTLSIIFNEASFNEEPYQKMVLESMNQPNHHSYRVDENMFMDNFDDIFTAMDQPSWDGVNSYFISKCAHEAGLKAVLSGVGGDELFGGYPSFNRVNFLKFMKLVPSPLLSLGKYIPGDLGGRISQLGMKTDYNEYLFLRGGFDAQSIAHITHQPLQSVIEAYQKLKLPQKPIKYDKRLAMFLETNVYMENQLLKDVDYMSMWHSLEVRIPFLDKELMKLLHSIHPSIMYKKNNPKYLLTKAFEDILPPKLVFRKKQGFTFPFAIWLKDNMETFKPQLQNIPEGKKIVSLFLQDKIHWSRVWSLLVYEKFKSR